MTTATGAHVAGDPDTGIITDEKMTGVAGTQNSHAAVAAEFVAAEAAAGPHDGECGDAGGPLAWYGDSAYGTGELRAAITEAGHQAVIKPWPLVPAVQGGFTRNDVTVDVAARIVTCPADITRRLTAKNAAIFGVAWLGAKVAGCVLTGERDHRGLAAGHPAR